MKLMITAQQYFQNTTILSKCGRLDKVVQPQRNSYPDQTKTYDTNY